MPKRVGTASRGLSLTSLDAPLLDAVVRLLRLLDAPADIPMLAPTGRAGDLVPPLDRRAGRTPAPGSPFRGSLTERVARAIEWIKRHYAEPLSIETVAKRSLHERVGPAPPFQGRDPRCPPLQYQKHLRLAGSPAADALGRFRRRKRRVQGRLRKRVPVQPRIRPLVRRPAPAGHRPAAGLVGCPPAPQ